MLFAICSDRGSPGSTSVALALAAARGLPAVVVEADPYGGDLALRCRPNGHPMAPTPTILAMGAGRAERPPTHVELTRSLGSDKRRRLDLWREGSHELNNLVRVVPGFLTAEQGAALAWPVATEVMERQTIPVFADLGRIHTGSPSIPVACAADALVVVCRGDMASVQHMIWRLEQLVPAIAERIGRPPVVIAVVVAARRHGARAARQVAELLDESSASPAVRGTGWLAWDPVSVVGLQEGADPWTRPLHGSPLMKSAGDVIGLVGAVTGLELGEPATMRRRTLLRRSAARGTFGPSPSVTPAVDEPVGSDSGVLARVPNSGAAAVNNGASGPSAKDVVDPGGPSFERLRQRRGSAKDGERL